jgi:hypothetical protein
MPIPQLSTGVPTTIAQNAVYSLPTVLCFISSSVAIEASLDGTTWAALAGANTTGVYCGAAFVRCPTAAAIINCET